MDVSCSCNETKCNSQSPHLEQGISLGRILTFTPDCPQINSIYVSSGPLQALSHLCSQPALVYLGSSMSTMANYHIKRDRQLIPCHSLWALRRAMWQYRFVGVAWINVWSVFWVFACVCFIVSVSFIFKWDSSSYILVNKWTHWRLICLALVFCSLNLPLYEMNG